MPDRSTGPSASGDGDPPGSRPPHPPRRPTPPRQPLTERRRFSGMQASRTPEYLVIGHICADLHPDGRAVLGGTALYSALTAARLGMRVGVLTRGSYGKRIDGYDIPSLDQFSDELSIIVQEAPTPTFFVNEYTAGRRVQTLPKWAGPIDLRGLPPHWRNAKIVHLGPICQEIEFRQTGALTAEFLGVTPQGWMRDWPRGSGGRVKLNHLRIPPELMSRIDAIVVSDEEITLCRDSVEAIGARRLGVITMGEDGARVIFGGETADLPGYKIVTADLTGAGDTFAAAFFFKAIDRGVSAVAAARYANAVAALSLRGIGVDGVPTRLEVDKFLETAVERPLRR